MDQQIKDTLKKIVDLNLLDQTKLDGFIQLLEHNTIIKKQFLLSPLKILAEYDIKVNSEMLDSMNAAGISTNSKSLLQGRTKLESTLSNFLGHQERNEQDEKTNTESTTNKANSTDNINSNSADNKLEDIAALGLLGITFIGGHYYLGKDLISHEKAQKIFNDDMARLKFVKEHASAESYAQISKQIDKIAPLHKEATLSLAKDFKDGYISETDILHVLATEGRKLNAITESEANLKFWQRTENDIKSLQEKVASSTVSIKKLSTRIEKGTLEDSQLTNNGKFGQMLNDAQKNLQSLNNTLRDTTSELAHALADPKLKTLTSFTTRSESYLKDIEPKLNVIKQAYKELDAMELKVQKGIAASQSLLSELNTGKITEMDVIKYRSDMNCFKNEAAIKKIDGYMKDIQNGKDLYFSGQAPKIDGMIFGRSARDDLNGRILEELKKTDIYPDNYKAKLKQNVDKIPLKDRQNDSDINHDSLVDGSNFDAGEYKKLHDYLENNKIDARIMGDLKNKYPNFGIGNKLENTNEQLAKLESNLGNNNRLDDKPLNDDDFHVE
ncbi:hypothetical protein [Cysteiniphilum halobium]|uniref:hypothetical protein n=1 Tax=Cysteiniphilum halobium TaxID=2219059 RepID=UPI003F828F5B